MSFNRKFLYRTIATVFVATLVWLACAHFTRTSDVDVRWPTRSHSHTMLLRPATSPESIRLVDYAADQITVVAMRVEYRDGSTALAKYAGGKPVSVRVYYPLPPDPAAPAAAGQPAASPPGLPVGVLKHLSDGLAVRKLKATIEFKDDGLTIKSAVSYHDDGSFESVAVRDASDDMAVTTYGAPGVGGIARVASYNGATGLLKSEQVFRADGTVESSFTTTSTGYWNVAKQTFFDAGGVKTKEINFNGDYDISINEYGPDGKTLTQKTAFSYSSTTVTTYDPTGAKPVIERMFIDDSHISVRFFGADGLAYLQQRWVKADPTVAPDRVGVTVDGFYLTEVYDFHPDGSSVKNDISFYPGGKVVQTFENRPTTDWRPRTIKHYNDAGTLESTDDCPNTSYSCNTTKAVAPANAERAKVAEHYFKTVPLLPAPTATKPKIPHLRLVFDLR